MIKSTRIICCFLCAVVGISFGFSQSIPDKTNEEDYEKLKVNYRVFPLDSVSALSKTSRYLLMAKQRNDTVRLMEGYHTMSNITSIDEAFQYADSLILMARANENHKSFLAQGNLQKGRMFYRISRYAAALDYYFAALKASDGKDLAMEAGINFNIGLIKNLVGNRMEAIDYFNKYEDYLKKATLENKGFYETRLLYAKSDAFLFSNETDSAQYYSSLGERKALSEGDSIFVNRFKMNEGIALFKRGQYIEALNSVERIKENILDDPDATARSVYHLYVAKINGALGNDKEYISHLESAGFLITESNEILLESMETFFLLKDYYGETDNDKKLLSTIDAIIKYDSILDSYTGPLEQKIKKEYEIPLLMNEKETLINKLNRDKQVSGVISKVLIVLVIILVLFAIYEINKNSKLKKKFEAVLSSMDTVKEEPKNNTGSSIGISEQIVEEVLLKLDEFEDSEAFVASKQTLNSLAKDFKTNSAYLSKIINHFKGVNFSNYLNNLRVSYAMNKMKSDLTFRKYTIEAIAKESGFNNAQSFTSAFVKHTGLYPSYFAKQLDKKR
ncbi:MAG: helix-turn-helix domain-containing protein [Bacteroidota bacterium]